MVVVAYVVADCDGAADVEAVGCKTEELTETVSVEVSNGSTAEDEPPPAQAVATRNSANSTVREMIATRPLLPKGSTSRCDWVITDEILLASNQHRDSEFLPDLHLQGVDLYLMGIPQQPPRQLIDSVVAVVDDDKRIRQALERALRLEGYGVVTASDGVKALEISDKADVMVLDVTMPNLGGIDVCRQLRAQGSELPVLLLTARHGTEDRIVGLDSGADDYLAKPFVLEELLARIRALLRRRRPADLPLEAATLCFEDLRLDQLARQVHREDQLLALTRTEYELLELLLEHPNQVLTRDQIYEAVWGYDSALASNSLEVYIGYLRRKTEAGNRSRVIHTVRGVGYVLRSS